MLKRCNRSHASAVARWSRMRTRGLVLSWLRLRDIIVLARGGYREEGPTLSRWIRQYSTFLLIVAAALVALALWKVPEWQAESYRAGFNEKDVNALDAKDRIQLEKDLISAENNARATLALIIGGGVLLFGLYFTWRNLKLVEEGKLTERFSNAVELLGNDNLDVRLGGIYALERIARDSRKDHWTVMEVLTAFVREHSKATAALESKSEWKQQGQDGKGSEQPLVARESKCLRADIQAIMTVLGRRTWVDQEEELGQHLDLRGTFLENLVLFAARLSSVDLSGAQLSGANLQAVDLRRANLFNADLSRSALQGADLREANLWQARLNGAKLWAAQLSEASLQKADLRDVGLDDADLRDAFLSNADLTDAHLSRTDLSGATLREAKLNGADLRTAKLAAAKDLTREQISVAETYPSTVLPEPLKAQKEQKEQSKQDSAEKDK